MARALVAALAACLLVAVPSAGGAETQTPRRGGMVVLAAPGREPACLNAFYARCRVAGAAAESIMSTVLPGAFREGPGLTLRPNLVSAVEVTRTPPFTLTYRIRAAARWSDGTPVSARDFVFTHRTSRTAGAELHESEVEALAHVAAVRALDPKTVRVVLRSRFGGWRRLFPYVLPAHALAAAAFTTVWNDRIHDPRNGRPIGSGPFLFRSWTRGGQLVLERNPRWWGGRTAYLDRLALRFWKEIEEPIEWLRRREIHLAHGLPLSDGQARALRLLAGVRVQSDPGPAWEHLEFRVRPPGHPALRNKLVRRAIAHALDRPALVQGVLSPADRRNALSNSALFPTISPDYRPNWSGLRHSAAESARLFRQAGCRLGPDRIFICAGERLSLRAFTLAGIALREETLRIISAQLRPAGIEIVPAFVPFGPLFDQIAPSGAFDLLLFAWVRNIPGEGMNQILRCGGTQNYTGYCQRLVTRDLDEAERVLDADQRARVLHRVDASVAADVPLLPLYHRPLLSAARSTLQGYSPSGNVNPFMNAENWWLAQGR